MIDRTLYTQKLIDQVDNFGYPWLKVATLVVKDGKYLLVHEAKVKERGAQGETIWVPGDGGWNIPAGRVEPDEPIIHAAIREVEEETGYSVNLDGICQIGWRTSLSNPYVIPIFLGSVASEQTSFHPNEEISEYAWLTKREIHELAGAKKLRSPHLVASGIEGYISGCLMPLSLISIYS